ncbi:HsdM family class I SAM-dependent methyltransferase [Janthinobacterium sp. RT4P48]|uniref:HsdM family class I SAM-dependent methyltransferase n=1 Tax=Janthinobacterium sp. RT4P48 TaxID=3424188 RepID=UPI003F23C346
MAALLDHNRRDRESDVQAHDISHRKKIGAFYTPLTVSTVLSSWGIRSSKDTILEPCFGGCTFLEAAVSRLTALGSKTPEKNLFGCDIDPLAFVYLAKRVERATVDGHFFKQDFIKFLPDQLPHRGVDLVIGNPPYIRHSNFSSNQRALLDTWTDALGIKLHRRANLWAYFVLHALRFLKPGGRVALVLPGSFLYADYSATVRKYLLNCFKTVTAITLAERLFVSEGTEETTVILLADGYDIKPQNGSFRVTCADSVDDLSKLIANPDLHASLHNQPYDGHGMVPIEVGNLHLTLSSKAEMRTLGSIATMRIGLVTGDTPYFIKSKREWKKHNIDAQHLEYIFPKSVFVQGLVINHLDKKQHISDHVACLALSTPAVPRAENLVEYLNGYPKEKRKDNATFAKRQIWHQFADEYPVPDAFFVFMTDYGPRIVLNHVGAYATNSVYRVFFNEGTSVSQMKLVAVSMYTSFTQLGAEIVGHPRGSGALKLEPSSALKLVLYLPTDRSVDEIDVAFQQLDSRLRESDLEGARVIADDFLFSDTDLANTLPSLRAGLSTVRQRRIR